MSLEVLKDLFGLIGSILAIVPFIRDFVQRHEVHRWRKYGIAFPIFRERTDQIGSAEEVKLREPSSTDMKFVMIGISLLIASFAVSFYISLHAPH
ncbi:MAG TPA: hypothetical protein VGM57_11860 [Pseudolabrys sp.]|jgi:hypothetical protein